MKPTSGGKSRGSGREAKPVSLCPQIVAVVDADYIGYRRFRQGSMLVRFRDGKTPKRCTKDQVARVRSSDAACRVIAASDGSKDRCEI